MTESYVGRFAPSPTGPLHFGSLVAATGSYLEARGRRGRWLLRIEDVDLPRVVGGAEDAILRALERFGFEWDGIPIRQRDRHPRYQEALATLRAAGRVFDCACSRKEIGDSVLARDGTARYPGTCRHGLAPGRKARAVRLKTEPGTLVCVEDAVQGRLCEDVAAEVGDFVLKRADGLFAYQLAVVVDDHDAGVTDVVRGADLIGSTCRQAWLLHCLGLPVPRYAHLPVATDRSGDKLSKQTRALALDEARPGRALHAALAFLGQAPPGGLEAASPATIWQWARAHWQLARVPAVRSAPVAGEFWEER